MNQVFKGSTYIFIFGIQRVKENEYMGSVQDFILLFLRLVWTKRIRRQRESKIPLCNPPLVENFSSHVVTFRILSNINDEAPLRKQQTGLTRWLFRDKRYVVLLQASEMSAGWHSISLILGMHCCRINSLKANPWPNCKHSRVQPWRKEFISRVGRIFISLSIQIL